MTAAFLAALALDLAVRLWLSSRQMRSVVAHRDEVPAPFRGQVPPEAHRKAADYTAAKLRLGRVQDMARAVLLLLWTLGGGLDLLDRGVGGRGVPFVLGAFLVTEVLLLPFAVYRVFGLEERFGFNRTTPRLFAQDLLKEALLAAALVGALAWAALQLVHAGGPRWWLLAWALWAAVSVLLAWAWPAFVAPLFHRFRPLPEGELGERIRRLLDRLRFPCGGVFVMDGSRRSTHANAFLAGIGGRRRIVLFDTLCSMLGPAEVEAVLAHELGHVRHRHVAARLAAGAAVSLAGFAVLDRLLATPSFFAGLGVERASPHAGILLFLWTAPLFTLPFRPLARAWSRRQEFAADAFAARNAGAAALARALVKLHEGNAGTLTPDRLYSAFHDSHPPVGRRVARLSVE